MSDIDEVKQRVDIVELISRYTPLKKAGSTYKGLCPFHSERTPSFVVFPHTGTWHCFGACGTGGDVFSFLMKKENLDFRQALEQLAAEVGVELQQDTEDPAKEQRTRLHEINEAAAAFYREILLHHPAAAAARSYLERRHIDAETAERFQLGFALDAWDSLRTHLSSNGFRLEDQVAAGVLKFNEERQSTYDAFRNRVIIPIRDWRGRVIGFGGRVLGDQVPKYLNTAETAVFHKSSVIYGFDLAHKAIADHDKVVIVEGYMDVIAAHQHGFANVVACMGTAVTADQLQQLQRYTQNFVLALDADAAGQQATIRGLNQAREALARSHRPALTATGRVRMQRKLDAHLFVASIPAGRDPDDVIRQDAAAWEQLVAGAAPLVDYYFEMVGSQVDLTTAQGKATAVTELAGLVAELGDEIERQHYVQRLSRLVEIDERTIEARVQAAARTLQAGSQANARRRSAEIDPAPAAERPAEPAPTKHRTPAAPTGAGDNQEQESHLLAGLLRAPELLFWLAEATDLLEIDPLDADDLADIAHQEIFRSLKRYINSDAPWDAELFQESLTDHLHGQLANLLAYGARLPEASDTALREDTIKCLLRMRLRRLHDKSTKLRYLLDEAHTSGDADAVQEFKRLNNQHLRELYHLQWRQANLGQLLSGSRRRDEGVRIR